MQNVVTVVSSDREVRHQWFASVEEARAFSHYAAQHPAYVRSIEVVLSDDRGFKWTHANGWVDMSFDFFVSKVRQDAL